MLHSLLSPSCEKVLGFADDLILLFADLWKILPTVVLYFSKLEKAVSLRVNWKKSQLLPLWSDSLDNIRRRILAVAPLWAAIRLRRYIEYLGVEIGPEFSDHFWVSPLRRFRDSARQVKRIVRVAHGRIL